MGFYDLPKDKRIEFVHKVEQELKDDLEKKQTNHFHTYASDEDTYIRKTAYQAIGRIYFAHKVLQNTIEQTLRSLFTDPNEKVRQTVINALGEIGKKEAEVVFPTFEKALFDEHHSVRNAVIGSLKKMGEVNPSPVIQFSKRFLNHPDPEVRRQVIHGVELRGRTHPEEVLPLVKAMQNEQNRRVQNMVIHVIGQISYKEGCLEKVITDLKKWENKELVQKALIEIIETHKSYEKFSAKSVKEVTKYIKSNFGFFI